jgi:hypothetical protein
LLRERRVPDAEVQHGQDVRLPRGWRALRRDGRLLRCRLQQRDLELRLLERDRRVQLERRLLLRHHLRRGEDMLQGVQRALRCQRRVLQRQL